MDKNIKISEEAYEKIKIMAGDNSLKDIVDELVGLNGVETPRNLDELILNKESISKINKHPKKPIDIDINLE